MKDFEEIRDTEPLSLKKLNDQIRALWHKTKNINIRDTKLYGADGKPILNGSGILQSWGDSIADNLAPGKNLKMYCYIPEEVIDVRKMLLQIKLEPFRAYSTGASSGGSASTTSGSGGSASVTSGGGGGQTKTSGASSQNSSGGGGAQTQTSGSSSQSSSGGGGSTTQTSTSSLQSGVEVSNNGTTSGTTIGTTHTHNFTYYSFALSTFNGHTHNTTIGNHTHGIGHTHDVTIANHTHGIGHTHDLTVDSHTHGFTIGDHSHSVSIGSHSHGINYGIYESTLPQNVRIYIDGVQRLNVAGYNTDQAGLIITDWVQEPGWHTIQLSSDTLGRINCAYFLQAFVGL